MKTLTYNSGGLSVRDRLTITNLLGLFESRLNAKWVSVTATLPGKPFQILLLDVDEAEGLKNWRTPNRPHGHVAVTSNDRWPDAPFILRPIRAFGSTGVVVLFNSIARALESLPQGIGVEPPREPARVRMTARLELPVPHAGIVLPPSPVVVRPAVIRVVAPPPPPALPRQPIAEEPIRARVSVKWGPPEPVILTPLARIPSARIHQFGSDAPRHDFVEIPLPKPSIFSPGLLAAEATAPAPEPAPQAQPAKSWTVPDANPLPDLENMPHVHRPTEIHQPSVPIIGRARLETPAPAGKETAPVWNETPFLRPSPPQWKAPEPEAVPELIDFHALRELQTSFVRDVEPEVDKPEFAAIVPAVQANEVPALEIPENELQTAAEKEEIQALFAAVEEAEENVEKNLDNLSNEIAAAGYPDDLPALDAEADWWGSADLEAASAADAVVETSDGSQLLSAIKAIKASGQPGILEIAGLPAVCVIPSRNVYFTTAPAARIETAIGAASDVTWRACASETEARQISGTEQSRQASLELLSWTASLLTVPADPSGMADRSVRLRRWPPITESRGRSKFLRYATLLSGAHATPREIAEITGDTVEEIVRFVNACSRMNLLDTSGRSTGTPAAIPHARSGGAGILRGMIEQLVPPKI